MGDRGGQRAEGHDPLRTGEFGAGLVQGLLYELAFRHVLECADEKRSTRDLFNDVGEAAHMLQGATRCHNPEYEVDVDAFAAALEHRVEGLKVLWVDDLTNPLH